MTVHSTYRRAGPFNGNGVATQFPFAFKVFQKSDVLAIRTSPLRLEETLVLDSDFTVLLNPDQDAAPGGTVTYPASGAALPAGWKLTLISTLESSQLTDITNVGRFNPDVIERTFDKGVILVQQVEEGLSRALQVPVSSDESPAEFIQEILLSGAVALDAAAQAAESAAVSAANAYDFRSLIDSAKGAALIGFKYPSSGSVGLTLLSLLGQRINVTFFGAKGDGVHDDTLAVQTAVAAASIISNGAVVWFPDGQYKLSGTITIARNGVRLLGASRDSVTCVRTAAYGPMFVFSKGTTSVLDGSGIAGMRLVDNGALNRSGTMVQVENASRWACEDIVMFGGSNGIILKGAANVGISDVFMYMQTPSAPSTGRYGIRIIASDIPNTPIPYGSNIQLTNVHVYGGDNIGATYANLDACLEIEAVDGLWLTSCYFGGAERADMWITRINPAHTCGNIYAVNTMWDICRGNGVLFGGTVLAQRVRLHGSVSCAGAGVAGKDGVYIAGPVDNIVLDTTIDGWKGNGLHLGVTAGVTCTNVNFSNGIATANTGYGVQIEENTGTNQIIVTGNNLAGNGVGSIRDLSAPGTLKNMHGNLAYSAPWDTYTPFLGAFSGSVTAPASGRFQQVGSTVNFKVQIGPVSADSGAAYLTFTLPPAPGNPVDAFALAGSELTTNTACTARTQTGSNVATLLRYDGTYPSAVGRTFVVSGSYQVP